MRIIILSRNADLYSTRSIYNAARRRNHFVRVVDHMLCDLYVENGINRVFFNGQLLDGYDVIIPRIGNTVTKHGAAVIRQFQSMRIPTVLDADALLNARNKMSCLQLLSMNKIPVPKTLFVNNIYTIGSVKEKIPNYPKILKVLSGTHGSGVLKIENEQLLESMLETFYGLNQKVLIQEFIEESNGKDLRVFVVDGQVVASMLRSAQEGDFRSNLHRGGSAEIVEITEIERKIAIDSVQVMGLKVAGVDMLRSKRGPLVLEVNASPGLEGIETITKVDVAKEIIKYTERVTMES